MDGVSALSLLAAVIEITRFCFDFVQTVKDIHSGKDGLQDLELERFTREMTKCIAKIQSNPARSCDNILAAECSQLEGIAKELLDKLAKRKQPGKTTLRKILSLMHPKELEELEKKLRDSFDRVQLRHGVLLSNQSIEISSETNAKTKDLEASISQVHGMLYAFAEESRVTRDNQHMQVVRGIEASTSKVLAEVSVTREQQRVSHVELLNEIRHSSRRQHDRNQWNYRISKGYGPSVPQRRAIFRRRPGNCDNCGLPGHWAVTCRRENLTCYRCHEYGHRAENCQVPL